METRAKYYVNLKTGKSLYLCSLHVTKVARCIDDAGRMSMKRGVKSIGTLHQYTIKQCAECLHQKDSENRTIQQADRSIS